MKTSESITNLTKALLIFDKEVGKVSKSETNPFFKNKYAPLPQILDEIKAPLQNSGLTVKQFPTGEHGLCTMIIHCETGEYISSEYEMKPSKSDPQGEGSRITYQRRYALGAVLGLNIDVDDDGNKASKVDVEKPKETPNGKPTIDEATFNKAMLCNAIKPLQDTLAYYEMQPEQKTAIEQRIINLTNTK